MLMKALVLICAADVSDCNLLTAEKIAAAPLVESQALCAFQQTVLLAQNHPTQQQRAVSLCAAADLISTSTDTISPLTINAPDRGQVATVQ